MTRKSTLNIAIGTGIILLVPLVLTIRDGGVEGVGWNWRPGDFLLMGALLFATGLALDVAWRRLSNPIYRALVCTMIVLALLAIWVELATDGLSRALGILI